MSISAALILTVLLMMQPALPGIVSSSSKSQLQGIQDSASTTSSSLQSDLECIQVPAGPVVQDSQAGDGKLPWITRYMQTQWEIVEDGKASYQYNCTSPTNGPAFTSYAIQENRTAYPDMNDTVVSDPSEQPERSGIDSDPIWGKLATPLTPAKKGHYFPLKDYSRMYFDFNAPLFLGQYRIHLEIEQVNDVWSRTLTVALDGNDFFTDTIGPEGFHDEIWTPFMWSGSHTIRVQINYGALVDKAWKLEHFWVYDTGLNPMDVTAEYTYQDYHCKLVYLVEMGPNTIMDLKTENGWDDLPRFCYVYVDGVCFLEGYSPGQYSIDLGDYPDGEVHEITIDIWSCANTEYQKKVTIMLVHHDGAFIEMDYRYDHVPDSAALEYFTAYYRLYSYHRVTVNVDESLPSSVIPDTITDQNFNWDAVKAQHFSKIGQWTEKEGDIDYIWCLNCHYIYGNAGFYGGDMIAVADQSWIDYCNLYGYSISFQRRAVFMHEFGHYIGMPHYTGNVACPNYPCVSSSGVPVEHPTYCVWHWTRGAYYETIWHEPCGPSTSDWVRANPSDGFEAYRTQDASGTMKTPGWYFYCNDIQSSSQWKHGPLFIHTLEYRVELRDIRAFEVYLELFSPGNRMGDLVIILYDQLKQISMVFCLYDSWYNDWSRAYLDYWLAGTGYNQWNEGDHWDYWNATWRFWFDPHTQDSWSLKSLLDSGDAPPHEHTHYTAPSGENLRWIKYIGIQFARASTYNFHDSYVRLHDMRLWYHDDVVRFPLGALSMQLPPDTEALSDTSRDYEQSASTEHMSTVQEVAALVIEKELDGS